MAWLFGDVTKNPDGELQAEVPGYGDDLDSWTASNLGHIIMLGPREAHTKLELTGTPGMCSGVYYALTFQLTKWEMKVHKADEEIEVSPVHAQYYQLTAKQKEELEAKIKAGLASAAQSISDYELLKHDERKYQEFKNYYDTKDEHSLRAVFIDQVDVHTGDGISMRSIVSRWPTLISDFMRLTPDDLDPDKVKGKLGISKAEAVVLVTKNKLYNEWKSMFIREVESRLERIRSLVLSRETSIREYREWLKPYVARFKMLEQAFEAPARRKEELTSFIRAGGQAVSTSRVRVWVWKDFQPAELKRMAPELIAEKPIHPYDEWTKRNVIFHPKWGLVREYPWIVGRTPGGGMWADEAAKWIYDSWMVKHRLYYGFLEIIFDRTNIRGADGHEIEDGLFDINGLVMSQNALLAKLMELKAKQEELERYIDSLLGIKPTPEAVIAPEKLEEEKLRLKEAKAELKKEEAKQKELERRAKATKDEAERARLELEAVQQKKKVEGAKKDIAGRERVIELMAGPKVGWQLPFGMIAFRPGGHYERMLEERLTKYYAKAVAENVYAPTVSFLKEKFGFGRP